MKWSGTVGEIRRQGIATHGGWKQKISPYVTGNQNTGGVAEQVLVLPSFSNGGNGGELSCLRDSSFSVCVFHARVEVT